jgi:hypothetical protein
MPHWYGIVTIQTPDFIKGLEGDRPGIRHEILKRAPEGVSVSDLHWYKNKPQVGVTAWGGDAAYRYLKEDLGADPIEELLDTAPPSPE